MQPHSVAGRFEGRAPISHTAHRNSGKDIAAACDRKPTGCRRSNRHLAFRRGDDRCRALCRDHHPAGFGERPCPINPAFRDNAKAAAERLQLAVMRRGKDIAALAEHFRAERDQGVGVDYGWPSGVQSGLQSLCRFLRPAKARPYQHRCNPFVRQAFRQRLPFDDKRRIVRLTGTIAQQFDIPRSAPHCRLCRKNGSAGHFPETTQARPRRYLCESTAGADKRGRSINRAASFTGAMPMGTRRKFPMIERPGVIQCANFHAPSASVRSKRGSRSFSKAPVSLATPDGTSVAIVR